MIQSTVSNVLQHQAKHVKQSIWRKIFTHFFNAHICFASLTTQPKPKRKGRRKNRTGIIRLIWVLNLQAKSTKQTHLHPPQETSLLGSSKHNESHKIHPNTNTSHKTPTHTDLHDSHILDQTWSSIYTFHKRVWSHRATIAPLEQILNHP